MKNSELVQPSNCLKCTVVIPFLFLRSIVASSLLLGYVIQDQGGTINAHQRRDMSESKSSGHRRRQRSKSDQI